MSTQTLYRWGAIVTIVTALLFVTAAITLIVVPDGWQLKVNSLDCHMSLARAHVVETSKSTL